MGLARARGVILNPVWARRRTVTALGIVQILAFGSTYYLLTVLAPAIVAETGWPLALVIGADIIRRREAGKT